MARTGSSPPQQCIVINTETESRNYMIKYKEITMVLVKKLSKVVKSCQKLLSECYVHHTRYKSDQFSDSSGDMSGSVGDFKASLMSQSSL